MPRRHRLLLPLLAVAITACDSGAPETPSERLQPDGYSLLDNPPSLPIPADGIQVNAEDIDETPLVKLEPVIILGKEASSEEEAFGTVSGVGLSRSGTIFVLDRMRHLVSLFDRNGAFVRSFGRRGRGPGEFWAPDDIVVARDTVFVLDRRIHAFLTDGTVLWTSPELKEFYQALFYTTAGLMVMRDRTHESTTMTRGYVERTLYRYDRARNKSTPAFVWRDSTYPFSEGVEWYPLFMDPGTIVAVSAKGFVASTVGSRFHIRVQHDSSRISREYVSDLPLVANTRQDFDDVIDGLVDLLKSARLTRPQVEDKYRNGPRAQYRRAIGGMLFSGDGLIMVKQDDASERPYATTDADARSTWLLLNDTGKPIMRVILPSALRLEAFEGCHLAGRLIGESGEHIVARYDLPPTSNC